MKSIQLKSFKIGYGEDLIVFHPAMASVAQIDQVQQKFNDIADSDELKYEKQFNICLEAIAEWSSEAPEKLIKEKGESKRISLVEDAESTLDAVKRYFGDRTPEGEHIIREAYQLFIGQMRPSSSFL